MEKENDVETIYQDELSLAFHPLDHGIPAYLLTNKYAVKCVKKIDLTETNITDLSGLSSFPNVESLVLDQNGLITLTECPKLLKLHTLWLNNNQFDDLPRLMDEIEERFPQLVYLSLMRNPCCPGLMNVANPDLEAYRLYRLYIFYRLPSLITLDWTEGTEEEKKEARLRGQYAVKRKSASNMFSPNSGKSTIPLDSPPSPTLIIHDQHQLFQSNSKPEMKASYRGKASPGRTSDSKHSEGNRFIVDSHL